MTDKPIKRVDLSHLTMEQRRMLAGFVKQVNDMKPQINAMRTSARAVFEQLLKTPEWKITEGEPLPGVKPGSGDPWSVGGPVVNFVDKIEGVE